MKEEIKFISVNPDYCLGCKNCELGCASSDLEGEKQIFVSHNQEMNLPAHCRHCDDAFCLAICPNDAISEKNGVILLDEEECIGCQMCLQACPYGVITMKEKETTGNQVAQKCDLCYDRQSKGKQPACFAACPTQALQLKID